MTAPTDLASPLIWTEDGQPRSRLYDDVYYSAEDGLAESRAVFLEGCGLPDAWRDRRRFVVGELGFGAGLNVLALIDLWSRTRRPDARLQVFSVEAHPISADEARRALGRWPELAPLTARLTARWPGRAAGPHRVEFTDLGVTLDVVVAEAADALAGWTGRADAWFLDGFSPARNPAMWRDELLTLVAARSAPGAAAATFTVAGQVRRGLQAAGFTVEKRPGFGRKRERLAARLPGAAAISAGPRRVAIVGAGIAGASAARAVAALGGDPLVFDAQGRGAGASGNPAALVTPRLDAGLGPPAQLFAQAYRRALALYGEVPTAIVARGALQFAVEARDAERFAKVAACGLFEPEGLRLLSAEEMSARMGEPAPPGLRFEDAPVISPEPILAAFVPDVVRAEVRRIEPANDGFVLHGPRREALASADAVIVTAGLATAELVSGLPLLAVRGQASWVADEEPARQAAAFSGYVLPMARGLLFGATHDRGEVGCELRADDHRRNLATLAEGLPRLAERLGRAPLEGRASIRVTTPDYLPVAGPAPDGPPGLFALTGFGARGFTLAPLLAEHVAALALGAPSPLPAALAALVDPARFRQREARRRS